MGVHSEFSWDSSGGSIAAGWPRVYGLVVRANTDVGCPIARVCGTVDRLKTYPVSNSSGLDSQVQSISNTLGKIGLVHIRFFKTNAIS